MTKQDTTIHFQELSTEQKDEFLRYYLPVVKKVLRRVARRLPAHFDRDELLNVGLLGLLDALRRYNPSLHKTFSSYAQFRIKGCILDTVRKEDPLPRSLRAKANKINSAILKLEKKLKRSPSVKEIAKASGMNLEDLFKTSQETQVIELQDISEIENYNDDEFWDNDSPKLSSGGRVNAIIDFGEQDPLSQLLHMENSLIIKKALSRLPKSERNAVTLSFYENMSLKEIGCLLGITESRVSQLRKAGLSKIRKFLVHTN